MFNQVLVNDQFTCISHVTDNHISITCMNYVLSCLQAPYLAGLPPRRELLQPRGGRKMFVLLSLSVFESLCPFTSK